MFYFKIWLHVMLLEAYFDHTLYGKKLSQLEKGTLELSLHFKTLQPKG